MGGTGSVRIDVAERDIVAAVRGFLQNLLSLDDVGALLALQHLPMRRSVIMPALVTDPQRLDGVDPLAPAFPLNGARLLSRLSRRRNGGGAVVAAVLRPCEMRAFVELVKLKQGSLDGVLLVSFDCPGAFPNARYPHFEVQSGPGSTNRFLEQVLGEYGVSGEEDADLASACKICEHSIPQEVDLHIQLWGADAWKSLIVTSGSPAGEDLLKQMGFPSAATEPTGRKAALNELHTRRIAAREALFNTTAEDVSSLEKLMQWLARCVNCGNCRVACPVCYCRECVFTTDVFDHEPAQYLRWAHRRGILKMPTDTLFFHLTRLAHMSLSCVGCGQCSNACPNDVPVMELFRTIAARAQGAFGYEPGRSVDEEPPLSIFREREFSEVTGGRE